MQTTLLMLLYLSFPNPLVDDDPEANSGTPARDISDQPIFQRPSLQSGIGSVDFKIRCKKPLAQLYFNQGLSFIYQRDDRQAEQAFRQAAAIDPDCTMAYWGLALANRRFPADAERHLKTARQRSQVQQLSARERFLVAHWQPHSGAASLRKLLQAEKRLRGDMELKALLLWRMLEDGGAEIDWKQAEKLLGEVLRARSDHPIQAEWLARHPAENPQRLLPAARRTCKAMPRSPFVWRAAGRALSRAGQYEAAVQHYKTAMRLEHERMRAQRLLPEQVAGHAKTQAGLLENLIRAGRIRDALALGREMAAAPCLFPGVNSNAACLNAQRTVLDLLSRYELWNETIEFSKSSAWNAFLPALKTEQLLVLGAAYFSKGDLAAGRGQMTELKTLWLKQMPAQRKTSDELSPEALRQLVVQRLEQARPTHRRIESAMIRLSLYEALANKDLPRLRGLLVQKPNLPRDALARLHLAAGDTRKAKELAFQTPSQSPHRMLTLATQANVLRRSGETQIAQSQVEKLQQAFAGGDLDLPAVRRVSRVRKLPVPRLSLQRSHWRPYTAPDLTLPDRNGRLVSLEDYRGRPVLIVFYLGAGCPHCIAQLQSLTPKHQAFIQAGITVIAVSADTVQGLRDTYEIAGTDADKTLPFLLVSDSLKARFQAFRAYDEFSGRPLHGVFLLGENRRVLWQNTGAEPFMQIDFLLEESKRLLKSNPADVESTMRKPRLTEECR